jgi:hypothetical protein
VATGCKTPLGGCCNGVQGEHTRCGRSCSTAAANEFAREQRDRAWKMSKAVEEKAVDEIRRHWELFVENLEVTRCEPTMALAEAERASVARRSKSEGSYGLGVARPRIRARVFYQ